MRSDPLRCPRCDGAKKAQYSLCWRCSNDDRLHSEYQRGYQEGVRAAGPSVPLDGKRLRQLLQLCHPDRHAGSAASTEATRWLLEQRERLAELSA